LFFFINGIENGGNGGSGGDATWGIGGGYSGGTGLLGQGFAGGSTTDNYIAPTRDNCILDSNGNMKKSVIEIKPLLFKAMKIHKTYDIDNNIFFIDNNNTFIDYKEPYHFQYKCFLIHVYNIRKSLFI